ncbi:IS110 family transposase [Methylobacterium sp. NEAU 140]|uniref:IS110 family transposase n=1 Tax=Methylobacterium sp. NEAU 140 TaxID=3064945 RepID=UPI002733B784|nr:IS110 family transposase [Methylobacterium sp. NEAU 140]MDP4027317.1 IS110 family transposase [Methylobacterium sp. NEAU 140]
MPHATTPAAPTPPAPTPPAPTPPAPTPPERILGCDVGKASLVVFDSATGQTTTLPNQPEPLAAFAASLTPACLVVCEATGGYERALLAALAAAGCPAHRADARKVKAFIRSFGTLGKSDAIDARALACYGQERHARLARWQPPQAERQRLQTLVLTRADLVAQRTAFANRLAAPDAEPVRATLAAVRACLDAQIRTLDAAIQATIRALADLARAEAVLRSIGGVGPKTAAALLALMPELGHLTRRQAAALAGVAPHPNQSGATDAYRRTRGGRPEVKATLFMAALSAARHNPTLRAAYERLRANGKKPIVAITALMRRIIVIANARLRDALVHQTPQLS